MARFNVYVTRRIPDAGLDILRPDCEVEINPHDRFLSRDELLTAVGGRDGVIGLMMDRIDAEFFDAAAGIRGYANYAVGYDNVDLAEATRRGIPVSNTPGVLTTATAEMAWALLLAAARRVVESDRDIRSGAWSGWGPMQYLGTELRGRTLGIVGAGRIGTAMALMSRGFDMKAIYYQPSGDNETLDRELGARRVEFDRLLAESDFISIHTPLTPQTRHLFNADAFRRMKNTAYLINTSRGPVVNEADLLDALTQGRIAGAGLDVYEFEPQVTPGLTRLKNVVVAAHTGSATHEARNGMAELAAKNLLAMLKGQTPPNCLNPDVL